MADKIFEHIDLPNKIITMEEFQAKLKSRSIIQPAKTASGFFRYKGEIYRYVGQDSLDAMDYYVIVTQDYNQEIPTRDHLPLEEWERRQAEKEAAAAAATGSAKPVRPITKDLELAG